MTTAPTLPPTGTHRRRGWVLIALVAVAVAAGGAWWYVRHREPAPDPPTPDLSRADPEVAQAVTDATEAVRRKPRDAAGWGKLGMVLRAHDYEPECLSAFHAAARLDPSDYRWPYLEGLTLVLSDPDRGLERLRRAAELAPASRPEPRLRLAEVLAERGETAEAEKTAADVLRSSPGNARAELVLSRIAVARGDWPAVLKRTAGCADDPGCADRAAGLRGEALTRLGEPARAEAEFRRAANASPAPWPDPVANEVESLRVGLSARLAQAAVLLEQGGATQAIGLLEDLARRYPDRPEPPLLLGQAMIRLNDPRSARQVLTDLTTRFPDSVEGWFFLGIARFQHGDANTAADAFRRVIQLKPDHALAHFYLGHCYHKLGDKPAARKEYEEALHCRPDHVPSRQALKELDAGK